VGFRQRVGCGTVSWLRQSYAVKRVAIPRENLQLVRPASGCGTAVLVLAGSSGAVDLDRAQLLAEHGALAVAMRWFGGPGQHCGPWEIPLEDFTEALELVAPEVDRLAILGSSFGAEAALCVAACDHRVEAVVAIAPSAYVWPDVDGSGRPTSHWTRRGVPLAFVPLDETWLAATDPPAFRGWHETSVVTHATALEAAAIPVESIRGTVVVVAGGDDQVWPADTWARAIERRRRRSGATTTVVVHPGAGHRIVFPGERPVSRGQTMRRGGSPAADAALGARAWPHVVSAFRLHTNPTTP